MLLIVWLACFLYVILSYIIIVCAFTCTLIKINQLRRFNSDADCRLPERQGATAVLADGMGYAYYTINIGAFVKSNSKRSLPVYFES